MSSSLPLFLSRRLQPVALALLVLAALQLASQSSRRPAAEQAAGVSVRGPILR